MPESSIYRFFISVPQGVYVPSVISITSTNVILIWQPPARPNGNVKKYSLYGYYPMNFGSRDLQEIKVVEGLMMQYQVIGLMPFTNYSFRIEVENEIGKASSQRKNLMTLEDGILINFRGSHLQMFFKIGVLRNFAIFTGKHLCWSLFLIKLQTLRPATLVKRESNTGAFL